VPNVSVERGGVVTRLERRGGRLTLHTVGIRVDPTTYLWTFDLSNVACTLLLSAS
jgi:hypothetical protein